MVSLARSKASGVEIQAASADRSRFMVDFVCAEARLIVQNKARDADRTKVPEAMGYLVLRFWNHDVMRNTEGILEEIVRTVIPERL